MKQFGLGMSKMDGGSLRWLTAWWETSQNRVSAFVTLVLLSVSAWLLAQLMWIMNSPAHTPSVWQASKVERAHSIQSSQVDILKVQKSNLFGAYSKERPKIVAPVIQDAPKTRLKLILVGAVSSSDPEKSLAVIASQGKQSTYGIGEMIEGTRATLKVVLIDRIIMENAGRDETLMLEGIEYKKLPNPPSVASNIVSNNQRLSQDKLEQIRAEIVDDPQQIFQYVRLSQVKRDNKIVGYRVTPGKDPVLFESAGLKRGDIATQLNGEDLTDSKSMGKIFQAISVLSELTLTVERDGQQHEIYIGL